MTDNINPAGPEKLSDDELAEVSGGWGSSWSYEDEMNLRNEYLAANPNNPNPTNSDYEMFLEAKGLCEKVDDNLVYGTIVARIDYLTRNGA